MTDKICIRCKKLRRHYGHGFCNSCWITTKCQTDPKYRERSRKSSEKYRNSEKGKRWHKKNREHLNKLCRDYHRKKFNIPKSRWKV